MSDIVVVSPHLDDAVFSATSQLLRPGARVVTVFAGEPPAATPPGAWDRLTGAGDPGERVRDRWREDDAALRLCGATGTRLGMVDHQHRDSSLPLPEIAVLADELRAALAGAVEVWLPAAVGGHPDHVAARRAGLQAVETTSAHRPEVHLYADVPYALHYGWPPSVTGRPATSPYLDVDQWLEQELRAGGLHANTLPPSTIHVLDAPTRRRKVSMMRCYQTQLPALDPFGRLTADNSLLLSLELSWRML